MSSRHIQAPPTSAANGPYSGTASRIVGTVPSAVQKPLVEAGGMVQLLGRVLWSAITRPWGFWGEVADYSFGVLRRSWLPVSVSLGGFIVFIAVAALVFLNQLGATAIFPPVLFRVVLESFAVWSVALVVSGIIGAALTTELGARRIRDEIDALRVMGVDPLRELVVPRFVSTVLLTAFLGIPAIALSIVMMEFAGIYYGGQNSAEFFRDLFDNIVTTELVLVVINCVISGVVIAMVCAYKGLNTEGGATGLSKAVNQSVVIAFAALWIYQTLYTGITQGILVLGRYR